MALPDFLIVGAPKAGTTALHSALARHPELYLSRVKEPKFFLTDGVRPSGRGGPGDAQTLAKYVWRLADYQALFADAPTGTLCGESTTLYLHDPQAHRRIRRLLPGVKIIAVLRDPVDRAHSNWAHLWSAGLEPEADFVTACGLEGQRAAAGWLPFWRYLEIGLYGRQMEHLYSVFPPEQVLWLRYRHLREEPVATLDRICAFLGVATGVLREIPAENVTTHISTSPANRALAQVLRAGAALGRAFPERLRRNASGPLLAVLQREQRAREPLRPDQRQALIGHFAEDVALLERVTGEAFREWTDPQHQLVRSALVPSGRIGTAFSSIDNPLGPGRI
jgi:hypothetical protein